MKACGRRCFSASASKIKDVLIVQKSNRFSRLAGLSRVHEMEQAEQVDAERSGSVQVTQCLQQIR